MDLQELSATPYYYAKNSCYTSSHSFGLHALGVPIGRNVLDKTIERGHNQFTDFSAGLRCALFLAGLGLRIEYIGPDGDNTFRYLEHTDKNVGYQAIRQKITGWEAFTMDHFDDYRSAWRRYGNTFTMMRELGNITFTQSPFTSHIAEERLRTDKTAPDSYVVASIKERRQGALHAVALTAFGSDSYAYFDNGIMPGISSAEYRPVFGSHIRMKSASLADIFAAADIDPSVEAMVVRR